ncbi:MAG: RNA polymerase sigma factor [Polyangiales bacterium]
MSPPSLEEAYRTHAAYIAGVGRRLLGNRHDADELVQDVFLQAAGRLHTVRDRAALRAWLITIAVRLASRRLRRQRLLRWVSTAQTEFEQELSTTALDPEQHSQLLQIYRFLDTLPVSERLAWSLRHIEGHALEEVAALCRVSLATAKRRIRAAADKLEASLGAGPTGARGRR